MPKGYPNERLQKLKRIYTKMKKKVKEKSSTISIKFDIFVLSFIVFVLMSQTISVINVRGTCYFLHSSN